MSAAGSVLCATDEQMMVIPREEHQDCCQTALYQTGNDAVHKNSQTMVLVQGFLVCAHKRSSQHGRSRIVPHQSLKLSSLCDEYCVHSERNLVGQCIAQHNVEMRNNIIWKYIPQTILNIYQISPVPLKHIGFTM